MKITRNNYEICFVDYLEGNLEESRMNELIDFLHEKPDLKTELEMARPLEMDQKKIVYPGKEKLYKEKYDQVEVFNQTAVARLEGDLSETGKANFEHYLSRHPKKQKEAALFERTKLAADKNIVYPKKRTLYHHTTARSILLWSTRIAAVLMVAFLAYRFGGNLISEKMIPENQVAVTTTKPERAVPGPLNPASERENTQHSLPESTTAMAIPIRETTDTDPADNPSAKPAKISKKEETVPQRVPVVAPEALTRRNASFNVQPSGLALAEKDKTVPEKAAIIQEERLLADIIKEKTGMNNLSINKVVKTGLKVISSVSKEKFTYQTNADGDITELAYDSRLLAFSIPTNNN